MKVKFLLVGEEVGIPKLPLAFGVGLLSIWIDGIGFTSASNDLGTRGYILLDTPEVDLGEVGAERGSLFADLHGRVVTVDVKTNLFVRSGGIARIGISIAVQDGGTLRDVSLTFSADDCRGISIVSNALSFSCTMQQMEKSLAELDDGTLLGDDAIEMAVSEAPEPSDERQEGMPDNLPA